MKKFQYALTPFSIGFFLLCFLVSCSNNEASKINPSGPNPPPPQQALVMGTADQQIVNAKENDPAPVVNITFKTLNSGSSAGPLRVTTTGFPNEWKTQGTNSCSKVDNSGSCKIALILSTSKVTNGNLPVPFVVTNGKSLNTPISIQYAVTQKNDPTLPTVNGVAVPSNFNIGTDGNQDVTVTFAPNQDGKSVGPLTLNPLAKNWSLKNQQANCNSVFTESTPCVITLSLKNPETLGDQKLDLTYQVGGANSIPVIISYNVTKAPPPPDKVPMSMTLDSNDDVDIPVGASKRITATFTRNPDFSESITYFNAGIDSISKQNGWSVDNKNNLCNGFDFNTANACTMQLVYLAKKEMPQSTVSLTSAYSIPGKNISGPSASIKYSATSNLNWKLKLDAPIYSNLLYNPNNKVIYAGSRQNDHNQGWLYGISDNGNSGVRHCSYQLADTDFGSASIDSLLRIYVGTQNSKNANGIIYSYTEDCTDALSIPLPNKQNTDISIAPSLGVFYGSSDGKFNIVNGRVLDTATSEPIKSKPIYDHNMIYFGSNDFNLYALSSAKNPLEKTWSYKTSAAIQSSPTVDSNGILYAGNDGGNLYAFDTKSATPSTPKWIFKCKEFSPCNIKTKAVVTDDGTIYVGSSGTYGKSIYAVNADGVFKWIFSTNGQILANPVIGPNNTIFAASTDGKLYAIDQESGAELWEFQTDNQSPIYSTPALKSDQKTIYLAASDGTFYALSNNTTPVVDIEATTEKKAPFKSFLYGKNTLTVTFHSKVTRAVTDFSAAIIGDPNKFWSVAQNKCLNAVPAEGNDCQIDFEFAPTQILTGTLNLKVTYKINGSSYSSKLDIIDFESMTREAKRFNFSDSISTVAMSPQKDGLFVGTNTPNRSIAKFDLFLNKVWTSNATQCNSDSISGITVANNGNIYSQCGPRIELRNANGNLLYSFYGSADAAYSNTRNKPTLLENGNDVYYVYFIQNRKNARAYLYKLNSILQQQWRAGDNIGIPNTYGTNLTDVTIQANGGSSYSLMIGTQSYAQNGSVAGGSLYKISPDNGSTLNQSINLGGVPTRPVRNSDTTGALLSVVSSNGTFYTANQISLPIRYSIPPVSIGGVHGLAIDSRNNIYYRSAGITLDAINGYSQKQTWQWNNTNETGFVTGNPVVGINSIYIGTSDGFLHAIDKKTGLEQWKFPLETSQGILDPILSSDGRTIYVAADQGKILYSLSADLVPDQSMGAVLEEFFEDLF